MEYKVTTDGSDLLVLTVFSRVIMVSRDMSEITAKITEHYEMQREKDKDVIERANIKTKNLKVEERTPSNQIKKDTSPQINTNSQLGELFNF
jgi:hypothetical protein